MGELMEIRNNIELAEKSVDKLDAKANEEKAEELNNDNSHLETKWLRSKYKILKNLIVIGFGWVFLFTAYQSVANLQSSLNSDQGLGTASLSTIYVTIVLSCLLLPPVMISNLGLKWTIILSQFCYLLYIAANMYAKWYILIPAAVILGLGAAPLWTAKCTYLSEIAHYYSKITNEKKEAVVNRFFGIFFAMFQTTQIWGNVISSTILKPEIDISNATNLTNMSHFHNNINIKYCGALDCPGSLTTPEIKKPSIKTVYMLCGIYLGLAVISIVILIIFLDPFYRSKESTKSDTRNLKKQLSLIISTAKHHKKINQLLIIPITLWLGFEQAFIGADFTRSFVTCSKGINFVGLTMICYGVTDVFGSYLFGILAKYLGRIICVLTGAAFNYAMILLMLFWRPAPHETYVLFIIPVCWGLADAAWQTQINSTYGMLFPDTHEEAFSNFRLWESIGFAVAYAYSDLLCVSLKLYLLIIYLTIGVICYLVIQLLEKRKSSRRDSYDLKN